MNTIGRYQLVEKLGQGGMGIVYRAFDPLLQRVLAVKLIANLEPGDELRERFFREARAAGQLSHKNIITIHDLGDHEGQPFLAMEYLEGQDLQHRMASREPMTLARKLDLAIEICEGIEYAHDHGVIHRDIKPANIFITNSGTAKILDFGLARLITSELTNSNMMMGTLNYMAPEQVRGERADHRSDIFSTGVVLYEVFGGRRAFEGDSFGATLYKILEEVPTPLRDLDATLPAALDAIVDRALAKTREARYPHMSDMLRDLTAYRQQFIITNSPPSGGTRTEGVRIPSDAPRPVAPAPLSGARSDAQRIASDAPTMASVPTPTSGYPGVPASDAPSVRPLSTPSVAAGSRRSILVASGIAAVLLVSALAWWAIDRNQNAPAATTPAATETVTVATQQQIASQLEQASRALQAGDRATAQKYADAVLALSPGHAEARRLREQAQQAIDTTNRGLTNAKDALEAGRFEDATRAAGEVLAVDPANSEARRLMDEAGARSRGKGAEEARTRMASARNAAVAAAAPKLAPAPYALAAAAERDAASLYKRGRLTEATSKFWEASGLFRSAEVAAHTEAAARTERARATQTEQKAAEPRVTEPPAAPAAKPSASPALPSPPVPTATGLPNTPVAPPIAPPSAPQPAPQPPPAPETTPAAAPTAAIAELLERYEAALEARNLDAIKRIWPTLGSRQEAALRSDFQNASRIDVEIASPQITINGNSAVVHFTRRYQPQMTDGQRPRSESRVTMNLQRSGQVWTITQIVFEPRR